MAEQVFVAVALGSNLGDRERTLRDAVGRIGTIVGTQTLAVSRFVPTAPEGLIDQPDFLNAALTALTELAPEDFLSALHAIERDFGRDRTAGVRWGPRILDLDLLLYGDLVIESSNLTVPHPRMLERKFVLGPLAEIAPKHTLPCGMTVEQALVKAGFFGVER